MNICSQSVFSMALSHCPVSTDELHHRMYEVIDGFLSDGAITQGQRDDLVEAVEGFEVPVSFPSVTTELSQPRKESKCFTCRHRYAFLGHYFECGLMADVDVWSVKECDAYAKK